MARTVDEVTEPQGQDLTNSYGEDSGQTLVYGPRSVLYQACVYSCYPEGIDTPVLTAMRRLGRTSAGWVELAKGSASGVTLKRLGSYLLKKKINHGEGFFPAGDFHESVVGSCWRVFLLTLSIF